MEKDLNRKSQLPHKTASSAVNTIILGPVIDSQILTAGGSISVSGFRPLDGKVASNSVLYSSVDWELLDISGFTTSRTMTDIVRHTALQELRLLLFAIPPEGSVVLPPTYYCESPICREILLNHIEAIEQGYIRLITEYVDLSEYLERKKERYEKASHFSHYDEAYFNPEYPAISTLPFQKAPKQSSIGSRALGLWGATLSDPEAGIAASRQMLDELFKRTLDTERPAFLWENVAEHLESLGVSPNAVSAQQVRTLKNRAYLTAYMLNGINIPHGSKIVTDLVIPSTASGAYNLLAWQRMMQCLDVLAYISDMPLAKFLRVKLRPEVAIVNERIRTHLSRGKTTDWILSVLDRGHMIDKFRNAVYSD